MWHEVLFRSDKIDIRELVDTLSRITNKDQTFYNDHIKLLSTFEWKQEMSPIEFIAFKNYARLMDTANVIREEVYLTASCWVDLFLDADEVKAKEIVNFLSTIIKKDQAFYNEYLSVSSFFTYKQEMSPIDIAGKSVDFLKKDSVRMHDLVSLSVRALIQVYDKVKSGDVPNITSVYTPKERLSPFEHVSITPTLT
jgi:hypothetical protein